MDDAAVLLVRIEENDEKPYAYKSQTRNIYYIRSGTVSREATRSELRRMFQQSAELHYEAPPLKNTTLATLNESLMTGFLSEYRSIRLNESTGPEKETLLNNLSLLDGKSTTFPGQVLFGKSPRKYIPSAGIRAAAYDGPDKSAPVLDHKAFEGPLIEETPLLFRYLSLYNRSGFDDIAERRKEYADYPEAAIRESVVNAIYHRDYTVKGSTIAIDLFSDRMEITSPGGLPNTQTISKIRMGIIYQRNPLLVQYFYDFGYVERLGRGVQKMIQTMRGNGNPEPERIDGDGYFQVVPRKRERHSDEKGA